MVVITEKRTDEEIARERAERRGINAELDRLAQERQAKYDAEFTAEMKRRQAQDAAFELAVKDLAGLSPLYAECTAALAEIEHALDRFIPIEKELKEGAEQIHARAGLQFIRDPGERRDTWRSLRERAGLSPLHEIMETSRTDAGDIVYVFARSYIRGNLTGKEINVGPGPDKPSLTFRR